MITATSLHAVRHCAEARSEADAAVLAAMRRHGLALHLEFTEHGAEWSLSDGRHVPDHVARLVIGYSDVIGVGDTLLTGTLSQTWRFGGEE